MSFYAKSEIQYRAGFKTQRPLEVPLFCKSQTEVVDVHSGTFAPLCDRLEVAEVGAHLRSAAEDRGHTQRKLLQADTQR